MYYKIPILLLCIYWNLVVAQSTVLCENGLQLCVCRYNRESAVDFLPLDVDCSFTNTNILETDYTLPNILYSLVLASNNISNVIKTNILRSETMEKLSMNRNNIANIDIDALNVPNLTHLDLSENDLAHIDPDIFRNTKKLKYLNLSSNKLTVFVAMTFHYLSNLEDIILDRNNVGQYLRYNDMFQRTGLALNTGVKRFSINNINLNSVPDNFLAEAFDLRSLKMSNNNIVDIPELPFTLEHLDLSDNPITEIDFEDFSNYPALYELQLNNLQIKEVPEFVFEPLKGLKILSLERNKNLTSFSKFAFGREVLDDADDFALEQLSLEGSRVISLSEELEIPFGQLHKLNLQGNRWKCDCKILWLKNLQIPPNDYEHLRCYMPISLYNSRIFDLDKKYFTCKADKAITLTTIAAVAFCMIFASMALWFFVFLPKYQSRGHAIQNIVYPSTPYSVLPLNPNSSN